MKRFFLLLLGVVLSLTMIVTVLYCAWLVMMFAEIMWPFAAVPSILLWVLLVGYFLCPFACVKSIYIML